MTNDKCGVDVIILSLERASDTVECITSALAQECLGRVIVIDQGSSQETQAVLAELFSNDDRVLLHLGLTNLGVPGGRALGCKLATAEYVVAIDNDAVFEGTTVLKDVHSLFEGDDRLGAISFRIDVHSNGGLDHQSWAHRLDYTDRAGDTFDCVQFIGAGHALRARAYREAGGYDTELFFYWEELAVSYRLISLGYKVVHAGFIVVRHKVSSEQRIEWKSGRFYYFTRNRVAIEGRLLGNRTRGSMYAFWYLVLGARRGLAREALRGIRDSVKLFHGEQIVMGRSEMNQLRRLRPDRIATARIAIRKLRA